MCCSYDTISVMAALQIIYYSEIEHSLLVVFLHRDGNLFDLANSKVSGGAKRSDDGLGVKTLFHIRLQLLQELSSQEGDRGGAVPDLKNDTKQFKKNNNNDVSLKFLLEMF